MTTGFPLLHLTVQLPLWITITDVYQHRRESAVETLTVTSCCIMLHHVVSCCIMLHPRFRHASSFGLNMFEQSLDSPHKSLYIYSSFCGTHLLVIQVWYDEKFGIGIDGHTLHCEWLLPFLLVILAASTLTLCRIPVD